jgi:hypothetical protein
VRGRARSQDRERPSMRMPRETMRAIAVREFGGPEVLHLEHVPSPEIGPDELLVEVVAAGVNSVDVSNAEDASGRASSRPTRLGATRQASCAPSAKQSRAHDCPNHLTREGDAQSL